MGDDRAIAIASTSIIPVDHPRNIRSRPILRGFLAALVVGVASLSASTNPAGATEVAQPLFWKVSTHSSPAGPVNGRVVAATRSGEASGFMVLRRTERDGTKWLLVRIGKRPNDRAAWISAEKVLLAQVKVRIIISVRARTMALYIGGKRVWGTSVVVGKPSTPTPLGLFAVHDYYRVRDEMRPWIVETTAHSEALRTFLGGPARVAIHGRHGQLRVPWGSAASNGCIRAPDWALRSIRKRAPIGTPIEVN